MLSERGVTVERQGSVFKVSIEGGGGGGGGGGARGVVCGMSRASRRRLIDLCQRLEPVPVRQGAPWCGSRIDLTYPGDECELPRVSETKAHYRAFTERMRRRWPHVSAVARLEFGGKGGRQYNPHWHFAAFGMPYIDVEDLRAWWRDVIQSAEPPRVGIGAIRYHRELLAYVSKYVAKEGGELTVCRYPHATVDTATGEVTGVDGELVQPDGRIATGRVWRVHNRKCLPLAEKSVDVVAFGDWIHDVRRAARHRWPHVGERWWCGFTLYTDTPERWWQLVEYHRNGG